MGKVSLTCLFPWAAASSSLSLSFCPLGHGALVAGPGLDYFPLSVLSQILTAASCILLLCILVLPEGSSFTVKLVGCNFSNIQTPLSIPRSPRYRVTEVLNVFIFSVKNGLLFNHTGLPPIPRNILFLSLSLPWDCVDARDPGLTRQHACSQIFYHLCLENPREFINY